MAYEVFVRRERGADERHGTISGASRHAKRGEPPCDACRAAKADYDREVRQRPGRTLRSRLHARAQGRALRELKRAHEAEYHEAYLRHKAALIAEAELLDRDA